MRLVAGVSGCGGSRSTSFPCSKVAPALTSATGSGALTARQGARGDSMSLDALAMTAALDPGRRLMRSPSRTVANMRSIGFFVQVNPVPGRVSGERQQQVEVVDDLRDGLEPLGALIVGECPGCGSGVVLGLGAV